MIRWDPQAVDKAIEEVEREFNKAKPFLDRAAELCKQASKIPNLPQYMTQKISCVGYSINRANSIEGDVKRVREDLPEKELTRAKAQTTLAEVA